MDYENKVTLSLDGFLQMRDNSVAFYDIVDDICRVHEKENYVTAAMLLDAVERYAPESARIRHTQRSAVQRCEWRC